MLEIKMSLYIHYGSHIDVAKDSNIIVKNFLEAKNYVVLYSKQRNNFYLEEIDPFLIPSKIYGNTDKLVDRTINTFLQRPQGTGVLLYGEKGSGKTLFAKKLANDLANIHKIPTLIVNSNFCGDEFNDFIQSIKQPVMLFFDEFEKIYNNIEQEKLLTLLDGSFNSQKLFIVTCNEEHRLSYYMKNRPGRFYYMFKYGSLEEQYIIDYCQDQLNHKDKTNDIIKYSKMFTTFSHDILKAIVEELNRYNESVYEAVKYLNVAPENSMSAIYEVIHSAFKHKKFEGAKFPQTMNDSCPMNPFSDRCGIYLTDDREESEWDDYWIQLSPHDISKIDEQGIHYETDEIIMIIKKKTVKEFDIARLI